ncbi:type VII secretion protein EccB [Streptomyces sp. NPDC090080]|uniref:type VII secretion protein EccB n=1 Tax=Streptomyces sp. NPDC090080 TaxID=3365939 RepID=UPI003807F858
MMQTRREQVQAHRFVVSRLTAGLLRQDPDVAQPPTRPTYRGLVIGAFLGVAIALGFFVVGFFKPLPSTAWKDGKTLVIEEGTGNRYLYDGTSLRPVRNYTSARLIAGADLKTATLPADALAGTPHGGPVGIEAAPDRLPTHVSNAPWNVCVEQTAADSSPNTALIVGHTVSGTTVPDQQAILVRDDRATYYLIWHSTRFKLTAGQKGSAALGYATAQPVAVSSAFLNEVPSGIDMAMPELPSLGETGTAVDGRQTRVGQVFAVDTPGSGKQYFLMLRGGLVPLTPTQAALTLADPKVRAQAYRGRPAAAMPLAASLLSSTLDDTSSQAKEVRTTGATLPLTPPVLESLPASSAICVRTTPGTSTRIGVLTAQWRDVAAVNRPQAQTAGVQTACVPVQQVFVPPSGGTVVRVLDSSGGATGATDYLVADNGVKYRLASEKAEAALGADKEAHPALPSPLLSLLPTGPVLSPELASAGQQKYDAMTDCQDGHA